MCEQAVSSSAACVQHVRYCRPPFTKKIMEMRRQLVPFFQVTSGNVHQHFPKTTLHFWLLTDRQLEDLAVFYHQQTPCHWTIYYPCPISWTADLPLEEKRRRFGNFIGLGDFHDNTHV